MDKTKKINNHKNNKDKITTIKNKDRITAIIIKKDRRIVKNNKRVVFN